MRKSQLTLALASAFALTTMVSMPAQSSEQESHRVLVKYKKGSSAKIEKALAKANGKVHKKLSKHDIISTTLTEQDIENLKNNSDVIAIEEDLRRYPMAQTTPWGIEQVQAFQAIADGANGEGVKVCVIDSGIYANHEDYQGLALSGDAAEGQNWSEDTCGHGSHVAGTIAAANNTLGVVGVASGIAALHAVKVFDGPNCGWSYSSALIDAVDECVEAGANIINMSLGGSHSSTFEREAFDKAYADGVLSIAAAGNGYSEAFEYPASYNSVMSVAAVDSDNQRAVFSQHNAQVEIAAPGVDVLSTYPVRESYFGVDNNDHIFSSFPLYSNTYEGTATGDLVDGGICDQAAKDAGNWTDKVVLCRRDTTPFYDMAVNVTDAGGKGVAIYNKYDGIFKGSIGWGNTVSIPMVTLSKADGELLLESALGSATTVSTLIESGVNGYAYLNGTSMATPHVSGVAALVWSADPGKSNRQVRQALISGAVDIADNGRDDETGWGLVQASNSVDKLLNDNAQVQPGSTPSYLVTSANVTNGHKLNTQLMWLSGEANVDVYRNDQIIMNATANTGEITDTFKTNKSSGTLSYKICNAGTDACTEVAAINYDGGVIKGNNGGQWSRTTEQNSVLANWDSEQAQEIVKPLGDGSFYVSWTDNSEQSSADAHFDIRLQLIDKNGRAKWQDNGILVADRDVITVYQYDMDIDSQGNAVLAYRLADENGKVQVYLNKVNQAGERQWGQGIKVTDVEFGILSALVTGTSDGNIVVAWLEDRSGDVRLQKFDANGQTIWSAPVLVQKPDYYPDYWYFLISDLDASDNGAVILNWNAQFSRFYRQLWAQKYDTNGQPLWTEESDFGAMHLKVHDLDGELLPYGHFPKMEPDGHGGAVMCWDHLVGYYGAQVRAQHVLADGTEAFGQNGVELSHDEQYYRNSVTCAYDQQTGDIFAGWEDRDSSQTRQGIIAQRVNAEGELVWGDKGRAILPVAEGAKANVSVVRADDGIVYGWSMNEYPDPVYIQSAKLDINGEMVWENGITSVKTSNSSAGEVIAVKGGSNNVIYVWDEYAVPDQNDIMMQSVAKDGRLGK